MFRLFVDDELNLVFLEDSLASTLFGLIESDREYLGKWLFWVRNTNSVADVQAFIERSIEGFSKGRELVCAIEYRSNIVGIISYNRINPELKKVEIGYWLSENTQGQGIMSRCCQCLIDHAFSQMGMEKVEIHVATGNGSSRKLCERLGMTLEGVVSNAEKLHQGIVDHAIYGLQKSANREKP